MCLLMGDVEALKPSNTGWLIADVVADTFAFGWARTAVHPDLLALLADPQWQPYVVFPGEFVAPERVLTALLPDIAVAGQAPKRPLFVLLDATWPEARKMFRKSPYLNHFPVLSLHPEQISTYRLLKRHRHFPPRWVRCAWRREPHAAEVLATYLENSPTTTCGQTSSRWTWKTQRTSAWPCAQRQLRPLRATR